MSAARAVVAAAMAMICIGTAGACDGDEGGTPDRLVIAAGGSGDVYLALGHALAEAARDQLTDDVEVLETGGSIDNLNAVAEGRADVGFATVDATALAALGDQPFSGAKPVVALARLYDDYLQIAYRAESEFGQVGDLRDLRISTGAKGSGTQIIASRVLEAAGLGIDRVVDVQLPLDQSTEALRRGDIAAIFVTGGLPVPALAQLAEQTPIRLLTLMDEIEDLQAEHGEHYQARTLPPRVYDTPEEDRPVETLGLANVLVVRRALPDAVAYRLTELLFAAKPRLVAAHQEARRLDHRSALATFPVQLHPGAADYYRDRKVMAGPVLRPAGGWTS